MLLVIVLIQYFNLKCCLIIDLNYNLPSFELISIVYGGKSTTVRMQSVTRRMHSFVLHLLLNIKSFGILLSIFFGCLEFLYWDLKISQVSKQCHFLKLPKGIVRCFIFFSKIFIHFIQNRRLLGTVRKFKSKLFSLQYMP